MSEIPEHLVERIIRTAENQAEATGSLVEIQRQSGARLDDIQKATNVQTAMLQRVAEAMDRAAISTVQGRDSAVELVNAHTTVEIAKGDRSWKLIAVIVSLLIAASNIFGPLLARLLEKK